MPHSAARPTTTWSVSRNSSSIRNDRRRPPAVVAESAVGAEDAGGAAAVPHLAHAVWPSSTGLSQVAQRVMIAPAPPGQAAAHIPASSLSGTGPELDPGSLLPAGSTRHPS